MMPDISEILRKMAMGQDSPGDHPLNVDTPIGVNMTGMDLGDGSTNSVKDGVPDNTRQDRPEAQKGTPDDIGSASLATTDKAPAAAARKTDVSPIIQQYQALLAQRDPELQKAIAESERNDATRNLRTDVGQLGKNMVSVAAGRAGFKGPDIDYGTQEDPDSPVKKYIQMKVAQRAPAEAYLKDEDTLSQIAQRTSQAGKNDAAGQGKGDELEMKRQALELRRQELEARIQNGTATRAQREEYIGVIKDGVKVRQQQADQGGERLDYNIAKGNATTSAGVRGVSLGDTPESVAPKDKEEISASKTAVDKIEGLVNKMKQLKTAFGGYAAIPGSTKAALISEYEAAVQPLASTASGMGRFTVAHQHLSSYFAGDPKQSLWGEATKGVNPDAIDAKLDAMVEDAKDAVDTDIQNKPGVVNGGLIGRRSVKASPMSKYDPAQKSFVKTGAGAPPSPAADGTMKDKFGNTWKKSAEGGWDRVQ